MRLRDPRRPPAIRPTRPGRTRATLAAALAAVMTVAAVTVVAPSAGSAPSPDDPALVEGLQWNLERIAAPDAWRRSTGAGVTVAVVDSGADLAHVDLRRAIVGAADCIGASGDPRRCRTGGSAGQDDSGHGTHVAGIVAATTGNGTGVAGVAPDARLLVVRSLSAGCEDCPATGSAADVAAGIRWAVANGADIVNLSLGGGQLLDAPGCGYCDALDEAWAAGVIPVVATGNDAGASTAAADRHAVLVSATDRDDRAASYAAGSAAALVRSPWSLSAPGGEAEADDADCAAGGRPRGVLSTYWRAGSRDLYACLAGTSMAAPHVAGVLALLLSQGRRPLDAVERLLATATDLGRPGRDPVFGAGRVDAARAVGPEPAPSPTLDPAGGATAATAAPPPTPPVRPPATTTTAPPVLGDELAGVPLASRAMEGDDDPPGWAVTLAAAALAAAWLGLLVTARWGPSRRSRRGAGTRAP